MNLHLFRLIGFVGLTTLSFFAQGQSYPEQFDPAKCGAYHQTLKNLSQAYVGETKRDCRLDRDCVAKFTLGPCLPEAMNRVSAYKWDYFFKSTAFRELRANRPLCPVPACAPPPRIETRCIANECAKVRVGFPEL